MFLFVSVMPMTVVLGAHNLSEKETCQQKIKVAEYFQHPNFKGEYDFDIMLLKVSGNVLNFTF